MNTVLDAIFVVTALIGLVVVSRIAFSARHYRQHQEREMIERTLAALDAVEDQDPAFVAEARNLQGLLVPNAWVLQVATLAAKSNLDADAKVSITRAIYPHREPAGAPA